MQPDNENMPRRYLRLQLALFVGVASAIALFAFAVDPWGIWHDQRIPGFNERKFSAWRYQQLHKATAVACRRPDAVIMGSSRALALLPRHAGLLERASEPYNLAVNGARIEDVRRYLDLAYAVGPVNDVVIGLDFFMFGGRAQSESTRDLDRLAWLSEHPGCLPDPEDWLPTLFSTDALRATRRTLTRQRRPDRGSFTLPDGTWGAIELHTDIAERGQRRLFRLTEAAMKTSVYNDVITDPRIEPGLEALRAILENAKRNGTRAHVIVSPIHARLSEVIHGLDLWDDLEAWKRRLVEVSEAAGAPPIIDFSGYNEITTEAVPAEGAAGVTMQWWWDTSHYSPAVGDLILDTVLDYKGSTQRAPEDFGTRLERSTIEAHLAKIRADRARYLAEHGADLADLGAHKSVE